MACDDQGVRKDGLELLAELSKADGKREVT